MSGFLILFYPQFGQIVVPLVEPGQRFTLVGATTSRLAIVGVDSPAANRRTLVGTDTRRVTTTN